ncbi:MULTISPECIES: ABC transporter transmembrane domain-containing protein [unclassified Undibacterium]|uniref:ABC transporter transmembrane domain-containing protein n=1 Tax=unclassified Undibacterium TaxID=2630295 RepID=UPI002AC91D4A|nr:MULTISPECIES: ABC transporter transmembrane domain-containing protein [unclassified Undibacterium]MEB0137761.1 ABC transporter transmembrane domain-containing protein [Undibacterium sp. CCC2.1]MEB0174023.1 ABC transporter transmembrane domain-containing protein [Undibacterium sp. CCC1.1]MEB0177979.1 ABC transporter transmembrane domain-containing protein [Undibacterium sp. CCC3.4]MEB0217218.1 ABC transporter transmembrane domain-containing protein [Undibacterium sp. 5I2]WPX42336.1 ABC trans
MSTTNPSSAASQRSSLHTLKGLLPFLRPYRRQFILAGLALLVAAAATLAIPAAFRQMIDLGFGNNGAHNITHVDLTFLALFGLAGVLGLATAARFYLVSWLGERVTADIRSAVYAHVLTQSPQFFETTQTGEVLSRLTTDTSLIQTVVGTSISMALRNVLLFLGGLVMLFVTSVKLSAIILVMLALVVLPIVIFGRRVRTLSRDSQDKIADASALAGEILNAMPTVQAFTHEQLEAQRFGTSVEAAFGTAMRRIRARSLLTLIAILLVFGAIVFVLWLGAHAVMQGRMSGGELGQFILYAAVVAGALGALSEVMGDAQRAAGATERLLELIEVCSPIQDPAQPLALPARPSGQKTGSTLSLKDLEFHYPSRPDTAALAGLTLQIAAGETVAVVGTSGAGKTTLFQLLLRFYDPQRGTILLDGIDIRALSLHTLRNAIGIVPQETIIFSANAMENIRYGKADANDEAVIAAAKMAAAHEFIEKLPQGYHSFLGERGVRLSGGQRQRIAIARALLKNPPLLLLDEATSALDAESERLVQGALDVAMQDRSTIIIAHRLATVQRADRILVMEHGRIVETGSHQALVELGGTYAKLAALQFNLPPSQE